jgi:hypothetical protein
MQAAAQVTGAGDSAKKHRRSACGDGLLDAFSSWQCSPLAADCRDDANVLPGPQQFHALTQARYGPRRISAT